MIQIEHVLQAVAAKDPLLWAMAYRIMPSGDPYSIYGQPWHMPYLLEPYRAMGAMSTGEAIVVMKSAQTGWTEAAINMTFWFMDTHREGVLYVLPSDRMLGDFAQARLNKAIQDSAYLRESFTDVSNVGLKIGFGSPLYLRGARSEEKLREIPVGLVVRDEYDVMDPEGREMALTRLGASRHKWVFDLSNPGFPETGIHLRWLGGTQEVWEVHCDECGAWHEPRWPDSVDFETERLVCLDCGAEVDKAKGRWRATNPGAPYRSFRLSQLVSPTITPSELIRDWKDAQGDATKLQVFHNMRLGLPYSPEGARITPEILAALPLGEEMAAGSTRPCVMGIDVGTLLHVIIRRVEGGIVWAGAVSDVNQLDRMMTAYNVQSAGIDAMPETRIAKEFARRWPGRVRLVRYLAPTSLGKREVEEDGVPVIEVSRTEALDLAFARILKGEEKIPTNLPDEVKRHFMALTRQVIKGGRGVEYAAWVESGPDHFAHAFTYSELVRDERPPWEVIGLHV